MIFTNESSLNVNLSIGTTAQSKISIKNKLPFNKQSEDEARLPNKVIEISNISLRQKTSRHQEIHSTSQAEDYLGINRNT